MKVGVTGGSGFLGRYIIRQLLEEGHECVCLKRRGSDISGISTKGVQWIDGDLGDHQSLQTFTHGLDVVVHSALFRDQAIAFQKAGRKDFDMLISSNLIGSLNLISMSRQKGVKRFVFISSSAVHDLILNDRPLDELHPLWPYNHYGAMKGAVEKFVHSFGFGEGWDICSLRPVGIYGLAHPPENSRWFKLIQKVKRGQPIFRANGSKEVHAEDVAKAVSILMSADGVAGQAYNCSDIYIPDQEVAKIAAELLNSSSEIKELNKGAKNRIETGKLRSLGMEFGSVQLLKRTVEEISRFV